MTKLSGQDEILSEQLSQLKHGPYLIARKDVKGVSTTLLICHSLKRLLMEYLLAGVPVEHTKRIIFYLLFLHPACNTWRGYSCEKKRKVDTTRNVIEG